MRAGPSPSQRSLAHHPPPRFRPESAPPSPTTHHHAQAVAAQPPHLHPDQWHTVLVLAWLRQRLQAEHAQWGGMEEKCVRWLQAGWPREGGVRGLGATLLAAMKLVAA